MCGLIAEAINRNKPLKGLKARHFDLIRDKLGNEKGGDISLKSLNRKLGYARTIFRFASTDNRHIDRNLPFQSALKSVPKLSLRKEKASRPQRKLTNKDINAVLKVASPKIKAAVLLAINGGLNNSDIAHLLLESVDPPPQVLEYPRHKTYYLRATPLWPETKRAIKKAIADRLDSPLPYLFLSDSGVPCFETGRHDPISESFHRLLKKLGIYVPGKNFGALRTTFSEIGKEVGDDLALKALMGHNDGSSLYENYAKGVYVLRLKKVTDHVRKWLFRCRN